MSLYLQGRCIYRPDKVFAVEIGHFCGENCCNNENYSAKKGLLAGLCYPTMDLSGNFIYILNRSLDGPDARMGRAQMLDSLASILYLASVTGGST